MADEIVLELEDLREVAAFAAESAEVALTIFETSYASDSRPRDAIEATWTFARGGKRGKALRDAAWAALKAAQAAEDVAANQAARAAMSAASAAYLHPLARPTQVKHILGAAAHAARAIELATSDDANAENTSVARASRRASPKLIEILRRYPLAPQGGGRVGELLRALDHMLRGANI